MPDVPGKQQTRKHDTQSGYQRIEAGRSVTIRTVWKLAKAFNVRPREILPP